LPKSEFSKTFVRPDNTAVLNCPQCGQKKVISADQFRGYKHKLKVKCLYKKAFKVFLEFRKKMRKRTNLQGTYINHSQKGCRCNLIILDISVTGLAFSCVDAPTFKVGDELSVEFTLNDEHQTEIRRDGIVGNVRPGVVGAEFEISAESAFDGPLGYYVMS